MREQGVVWVSGYAEHTQTAHQIETLRRLGADVLVVTAYAGVDDYPPLAWSDGDVEYAGRRLNLADVGAVLVCAQPPELPYADWFERAPEGRLAWPEWFQGYGAQRDRGDALLSLLLTLESAGTAIFNPPGRSLLSRRKPFQLQMLVKAGCPVPVTLVTSRADAARQFIAEHGEVIVKPVAGGALTQSANALSEQDLARVDAVPVILQRRVRGQDIRVVVIDGKVISSASVGVADDVIDFRGDPDYQSGRITYGEIDLPEEVQAQCVAATGALGLRFAGIDLKHTVRGEFCFLECNSSPIYLDVERKLGHPITERLCRALLRAAAPRR
ncbi:MAG: RimK family alpha-L-glutamate ligase [Thiotrichales bacterium]